MQFLRVTEVKTLLNAPQATKSPDKYLAPTASLPILIWLAPSVSLVLPAVTLAGLAFVILCVPLTQALSILLTKSIDTIFGALAADGEHRAEGAVRGGADGR